MDGGREVDVGTAIGLALGRRSWGVTSFGDERSVTEMGVFTSEPTGEASVAEEEPDTMADLNLETLDVGFGADGLVTDSVSRSEGSEAGPMFVASPFLRSSIICLTSSSISSSLSPASPPTNFPSSIFPIRIALFKEDV